MSAFRYGWGKMNDPHDPFWVEFNGCTRAPRKWKDEIQAAALAVREATTKPLWLCFSGGIDSEIMCQSFFDQGIHFSVLTIQHSKRSNQHDIKHAIQWCQSHGVHQKIVELDMHHFFHSRVGTYANQSYITKNTFRYLQIVLLEIVEAMGGYAVLGGGEQLYEVDSENEKLSERDAYLNFEVGYAVPLEWCKRNNTAHEAYFYSKTPELCLSYLEIPMVNFALKNTYIFRNPKNKFLFKRLVYHSIFPALRPRSKFNGFENVFEAKQSVEKKLAEKFDPLITNYRMSVLEFRKQLTTSQ